MMFDPQLLEGQHSLQANEHREPVLEIKVVDHRYHPMSQILDACSLDIYPGEIVSLIGPSGCGKSTFLKIAADLLEPSDGNVICRAKDKAVLFQEHRLLPWKTLYENMRFGLRGRSVSQSEQILRMEKAAQTMGFDKEDLGKYPSELSGGMRQRAALARALAVEPDLLFLDEPFSALDIGRRRDMYRLLLSETKNRTYTVLMVTHDVTEALSLSDRVLVMAPDPGRFIKEYTIPIPLKQRNRHLVSDLEADLLSDPHIADLFNMANWEQLI
ncbi:MAG: ATP-binding cassette domain-containing protein [Cohaesibacter sp.]|jgi:NitT/TauT family transport system ATP-binding protein|nr:ATP-binding cassette domain-containing protein [Cohaesibacter sp.]